MHLTDLSVRALKTGTNKTYWDDSTPGFGVWVGRRAKTWTVVRGRQRERITIGRYPGMALIDARKEAKRLLTLEPVVEPASLRFEQARPLFLAEHYKDVSRRHLSEATRHLDKHFKPLEKKTLETITDQDIKKQLDKLEGIPSEQLHAYRTVRCFLKWCTRPPRRYIRHSPMEGYQPPGKDKKRKRTLTDKELKAVFQAADAPPHSIVRLLILWGTRQGETAASERVWSVAGTLTIPGAYTKNHRDHAIPVLPMARAVLASLPDDGPHYFPSRWGESHMSSGAWSKIKRELQAKSGTKNWQLRDLRRTFRTNLARLGIPRELAEVMINHAPEELDEIYDQYHRLPEKRAALAKYEAWLQKLIKN